MLPFLLSKTKNFHCIKEKKICKKKEKCENRKKAKTDGWIIRCFNFKPNIKLLSSLYLLKPPNVELHPSDYYLILKVNQTLM